MAHAKPDYMIHIALIGVLLSIGIPALRRGQFIVGGICTGLAAVAIGWFVVGLIRQRRL